MTWAAFLIFSAQLAAKETLYWLLVYFPALSTVPVFTAFYLCVTDGVSKQLECSPRPATEGLSVPALQPVHFSGLWEHLRIHSLLVDQVIVIRSLLGSLKCAVQSIVFG